MVQQGETIDVTLEKPASGGRMIARHDGRVLLVAGGIPGERVRVALDRVDRKVAFASVTGVLEASPDRREPFADPACGGCVYAHIGYDRQRDVKAAVIADAFARIGRLPLPEAVDVAASPETGYRMRARLHVRGRRVGFYREGTHELCDAATTGQLTDGSVGAAGKVVAGLSDAGFVPTEIEIAENIAADQRILHVALSGERCPSAEALEQLLGPDVTGVSVRASTAPRAHAGAEAILESLAALSGRRASGELRHRAESFFQANRYLLPALVQAVLDAVLPSGEVLDLYAGVGLFSVSLAATGITVSAVEGDRTSGTDLRQNAAAFTDRLRVLITPVESFLARRPRIPPTVIVDPPRTGLSQEAADALVRTPAERLVYVSCDPPTMARDARKLLDGGYRLQSLRAFDLFPNTAHVETLGVFAR